MAVADCPWWLTNELHRWQQRCRSGFSRAGNRRGLQRMTTPKKIFSCSLCLFTVAVALFAAPAHGETGAGPRLILQITVDQLRGDLPGRYMKNMGQGGFRYLMKQGVWYANANYRRAWLADVRSHALFPGIGNDLARKFNWAGPRRIRGRSAGSVRN